MSGQPVGAASVTIRPVRVRRVCWVLAPVVAVLFGALATALRGPTGSGGGAFQPSDQVAMIVLGLLLAGGILLFTRPKVVADSEHIRIRNIVGGYDLPWRVVRAVRFEPGSPWLTLELADDDVVSVLAIQAADKDHAVAGARALRSLLVAHRAEGAGDQAGDQPGGQGPR